MNAHLLHATEQTATEFPGTVMLILAVQMLYPVLTVTEWPYWFNASLYGVLVTVLLMRFFRSMYQDQQPCARLPGVGYLWLASCFMALFMALCAIAAAWSWGLL